MTGAAARRTAAGALAAAGLAAAGLAVAVLDAGLVWAALLVGAGVALLAGLTMVTRASAVSALVVLGVAASCWDAVRLGGTSLFDALCAVGVVAVGVDLALRRDRPVPWPARACVLTFGGFVLATVLVTIFPPDSFYLASRFELSPANLAGTVASSAAANQMSDVGGLARLAIGVLALPVVLGWYARDWNGLAVAGRAFVAGAAVSSVLALTDYVGVTAVGETLIGYINNENRSTGLTTQPNHLALTAVMALPFVWLQCRRWTTRGALIVLLLAAIVVSGSRAGLIGAAVALVACMAWRYRARFVLLAVPIGAAALLSASELLSYTRFGTEGAADSDVERTQVLTQGVDDFVHSPLYGIGLHVSQEAHVIYLQLAASAGLVGLLSFALLIGAALAAAYRLRHHPVALAAGISTVAFLVVGAASNALLTRYMFVPLAILFVAARHVAPAAADGSGPPDRSDATAPLAETPGVRGG